MTREFDAQFLLAAASGRLEPRVLRQEQRIDKASKKASGRSGLASGCTSHKGQLTDPLYTFPPLCQGKNAAGLPIPECEAAAASWTDAKVCFQGRWLPSLSAVIGAPFESCVRV